MSDSENEIEIEIDCATKEERLKYISEYNFPNCDETDKYQKIAKIGHGTFGEVFKARSKIDQSIVALKRVIMESESEGFPITAMREIRILKCADHVNVVKLIEICRSKAKKEQDYKLSTVYLVFEFCPHDLSGLLSNQNVKFSLGEIKSVIKQLFNGLYYLHVNKICHRDLKTANLLISKDGNLKLADFGLARSFSLKDEKRRYTNKVVTLWYRPPELLLGERDYDTAVDCWSAGCIIPEMWTRKAILQGTSEQQQLTLISKLCGSLNSTVWPDIEYYELFTKVILPQKYKRQIKERFLGVVNSKLAIDLIDKLLVLDPKKRLDANGVLNHDFFWIDPLPANLSGLIGKLKQSNFDFYIETLKSTNPCDRTQDAYADRIY